MKIAQRRVSTPCLLLAALFLVPNPLAHAGSATWKINPTNGDWSRAANWTPNTVPNSETDVATFGKSNVTNLAIPQVFASSVIFDPEASLYTLNIVNDGVAFFHLWGDGVINDSAYEQTMMVLGSLVFRNSASAGERMTYLAPTGGILFVDSSTAGSASFTVNRGSMGFAGPGASAANATITTSEFGYCYFKEDATAGNAFITNQPQGDTDFGGHAGHATIVNKGATTRDESAGFTTFNTLGIGDEATVINEAATVSGGEGGYTDVGAYYTKLGSPTIINKGSSFGGASAGKTFVGGKADNATLIAHGGTNGGAGGAILFDGVASGGSTRVVLDGNGFLDLSALTQPNLRIGSVEGDGDVFLGATNLGIGTNNLSTQFAGLIQDGGRHKRAVGGSLTKVGPGTLTLTGANTYTGGTAVTRGALRVSNTEGSGTGTGEVEVERGTLGGGGTISGRVTVGAGGSLEPGIGASKPITLTMQDSLTFKADSAYACNLHTRKAKADRVVANGVTIEEGAHFDFQTVANERLPNGALFTAISNRAATPIAGTFADLPDDSTLSSGLNTFQVDYEGGDGNDLTLTVLP